MNTNSENLLAADTAMGPVTLLVADLDAMTKYYRDAVGLQVLSEGAGSTTLGRGATTVMILEYAPELKHAAPGQAGLFHTAILFDSERALAAVLYSVARQYPGSFTGSADHLVSKAFYFNDPEGNGVELYWDRDRSLWSWTHGVIEMATIYLDPNQFIQDNITEELIANPVDGGAVVGHVHLSVGDTASAREFYIDRLGFESTIEIPGQALFVSAGKYHHHMAMNVWNSRGAGRRQRTLGLGQVDIVVPSADDLGALTERMSHFGVSTRDDGQTVAFDDPWANLIRVTTAS
ncbi:VOC family protein [Glaciihabitans sp. dw_435]|uniref:VOC family protein n=1 Tax=Glaciihabitans sp. dw_435 TaxID=2720081 RepID=UPI001BD27B2C|nr:VOC family protein [Glaciihabitans sp. dw_435]